MRVSETQDQVFDLAAKISGTPVDKLTVASAIHQDLGINGDEGDEFVAAMCSEFGDWVAAWPWARFVDFNEPPSWLGPKIWKALRLPNPEVAFPGYVEERIELGHIVAVIEKGEWFEP